MLFFSMRIQPILQNLLGLFRRTSQRYLIIMLHLSAISLVATCHEPENLLSILIFFRAFRYL
jgi:hypothetical protein